jgi:hypothetical protein
MSDTTNLPNEQKSIESSNDLALSSLTDKNWLFIKHYLETADIEKAYLLAGYEGSAVSTKYDLFKKLKPFIEEIGNLAITSRLKLVADLSKVLSIPLQQREALSVSEWLRVRKFAASLTPEVQAAPKMSVLIVNRYKEEGNKGTQAHIKECDNVNNLHLDINPKDVIDIEPSN